MNNFFIFFIISFLFGCSTNSPNTSSQKSVSQPVKYNYLQEFYRLRDQLKEESKVCTIYSKRYIQEAVIEVNPKDSLYGQKLKNTMFLKKYEPNNFDWHTKSKMLSLYLNYDFNEDISKEHFEITNSIRDCSNDFYHMNFMKAVIQLAVAKPNDRELIKEVLHKYYNYLFDGEVSLLNVLTANYITMELDKHKIIILKNKEELVQHSNELEATYTKVGREILENFRKQNYKRIYELDKNLNIIKNQHLKSIQDNLVI